MFRFVEQTANERTAAAIRAELARRKITRKKLGDALGWPRTTTWRRLNGGSPLDLDQLTAIAAYLDVPVSALLSDRDAA